GGGTVGTITGTWAPDHWTVGQPGDLTLTATKNGLPVQGVKIAIVYPNWLDEPLIPNQTDANGVYVSHNAVVHSCPHGTSIKAWVQSGWPGGGHGDTNFFIPCT